MSDEHQFDVGDRRVDLARREVLGPDGTVAALSAVEAAVIAALRAAGGRIVPREALQAAWPGGADGRAIDNLVRRLRVKLEADPARPRFLGTVRGQGWRWGEAADAATSLPPSSPPSAPLPRIPLPVGALDLDGSRVLRADGEVALTAIERRLLDYLVERPGLRVDRDELLVSVWGWRPGLESRAVEKAIQRLRAKIERDPASPEVLRTDRGGVRWEPWAPAAEVATLPPEVDETVGREALVAQLAGWLATPGPITVKGPPGVGKSRVARAAARALGVAVDVVALDGDLVAAVARALGIQLRSDPVGQIGAALAARGEVVLLLEDLDRARSAPLDAWRVAAPRARILVTSVEPMELRGERVLDVGPLSADEGRELLVRRAAARGADWGGDPALPALVRALDALPFALELAAARAATLSPAQILARIDRLDWLGGGALRGVLEWTVSACGPAEREVLAALAVFRGGFTLDAAEAVAGPDAAEALATLVDRSLVARDGGGRFSVLRSTQRVAADHPATPGAEERHAAWFARLGEGALDDGVRRRGPWRALLVERDNLEVACRRSLARRDGPTTASLAVALAAVSSLRGPHDAVLAALEGVLAADLLGPRDEARVRREASASARAAGRSSDALDHAKQALRAAEAQDDERIRGAAWAALAVAQTQIGALDAAEASAERALDVARRVGDAQLAARAASSLGVLAMYLQDFAGSRRWFERALASAEQVDDRVGRGGIVANLGTLDLVGGDLVGGARRYEVALALHRETDNQHAAIDLLRNRGVLAHLGEQWDLADASYRESLDLARRVGMRASHPQLLVDLAMLARHQDRGDAAARHLAEAEAAGTHASPSVRAATALERGRQDLAQGRVDLARAAFEAAAELTRAAGAPWERGAALVELAWARVVAGDPAGAEAPSAEAGELLSGADPGWRCGHGFVEAARLAAVGDSAAARAAFDEAQALFTALPMPSVDLRRRRRDILARIGAPPRRT